MAWSMTVGSPLVMAVTGPRHRAATTTGNTCVWASEQFSEPDLRSVAATLCIMNHAHSTAWNMLQVVNKVPSFLSFGSCIFHMF
jgi:hypothetical protein